MPSPVKDVSDESDSIDGLPHSDCESSDESESELSFVSSVNSKPQSATKIGAKKHNTDTAIDLKAAALAYYNGIGGSKKAQTRVHFDD